MLPVMVTLPVDQGGLMRCCLLTLQQYQGPEEEGSTVACAYEKPTELSEATVMVVQDGIWRWAGPDGPVLALV